MIDLVRTEAGSGLDDRAQLPAAWFLTSGQCARLERGDARVAASLAAKRARYDRLLARGDYARALRLVHKSARVLAMLWWLRTGTATPAQLNPVVAQWWGGTVLLGRRQARQGVRLLVALFKAVGFVTDTPGTAPPAGTLTVYRGATPKRRRGLSWTFHPGIAALFAESNPRTKTVYAAEVPPQHVLGIFYGWREEEVVVNPAGLRNVREYLIDGKPPPVLDIW